MKILYRIVAWMVDFGRDNELHAVFLEQPRAMNYAANSHGTLHPLFERVEVPDETDKRDDS